AAQLAEAGVTHAADDVPRGVAQAVQDLGSGIANGIGDDVSSAESAARDVASGVGSAVGDIDPSVATNFSGVSLAERPSGGQDYTGGEEPPGSDQGSEEKHTGDGAGDEPVGGEAIGWGGRPGYTQGGGEGGARAERGEAT